MVSIQWIETKPRFDAGANIDLNACGLAAFSLFLSLTPAFVSLLVAVLHNTNEKLVSEESVVHVGGEVNH